MQFLNVDINYFDHPKTRRLVGLLGRGADVLPIKLWSYCGKYRPESGRLTDHSAQEIESIVGWWGNQGRLMEVLLQLGFVERDGEGFKVHDWLETQGHLAMFKERAKKGAAARWGRDAPSNASSNAQASDKQCANQPTNQLTSKSDLRKKAIAKALEDLPDGKSTGK